MRDLQRMHPWMKVLLVVAILVLLWALFWPRQRTYVKLVPVDVPGSKSHLYAAQLEAMYGGAEYMEDYGSGPAMVMFYAPWCGYCKKAMPEWNKFENSYDGPAKVIKINCDENKDMAKMHGVKSFPTIKFLPKGLGNPAGAKEYQGNRTMQHMRMFLNQCVSADPSVMPDQAAPLRADVPPDRAGMGPLTTSYVARNFEMS